tara:strand:+ start:503 stop:1045 length:543 start_codon:yes stop_codon:yes gene_type:complete
MTVSLQKAVESARQALQLAWDGSIPVKPEAIAQSLIVYKHDDATNTVQNIPIVVRAFNSQLLDTASGQASLENSDNGLVFYCDYNADEISYRNRFTIAHELGHVLLGHVHEGKKRLRDATFGNSDPVERAANAFAAELIMPEQKVRELFYGASSVQQLSEAFGVSNAAMSFRLNNLGLVR